MSPLVYTALGTAVVLACVALYSYYDNVRYNRLSKKLPPRVERRQMYVEEKFKPRVLSGVKRGYDERTAAVTKEISYYTHANKSGLWRTTHPIKRWGHYLPQGRVFNYASYRDM